MELIPLELFNNIYDECIAYRGVGNPDDFNYDLQSIIVKDSELDTVFNVYKCWLNDYRKRISNSEEEQIHYYGFTFCTLTKEFDTIEGYYDFKPSVESVGFIPTFCYWFKSETERNKMLNRMKEEIEDEVKNARTHNR